jgi:hypothetical protein
MIKIGKKFVELEVSLLIFYTKLHAPTSSTQKLKLMRKVGNSLILQHSPCRPPRPHTWILKWAIVILINASARIRTRDL